jgi:predicted secreted protein
MRCDESGKRAARMIPLHVAMVVALALPALGAGAQTGPAESKPEAETYQTLYLTNLSQRNEALDIQTALRNMLPKAKIYLVGSQNAITMRGTAEDFQLAQKMLADLNRAPRTYRVTYTITEIDGGKRLAPQHLALIVVAGGKTVLKQGHKVPILTAAGASEASIPGTQVQYLDVGLSIEASLDGSLDSLQLRSKVEQSGLAEEKSGIGAQDPVIQQTVLESLSTLVPGKPQVLGSFDVPGGTRHEEVEVVAELVR